MIINRTIASKILSFQKSILLLGPRQTGKSTLIKSLQPELTINLAHEQTYLDFASNPSELEERLQGKNYKTIFLDEVQRLPSLLNTLQVILDEQKNPPKFFLTGSSARKLKRGKANLLPGRIHTYQLGPLSSEELEHQLDTTVALETGTLPGIYLEPSKEERIKTLRSYAATYLKEEIQAEALTRNLEGFSRFLFTAAHCSGQFLDITKLANEAQVSRQSATRYFEILEETLIVHRLSSFSKNERKRLIQHPRYYFFDTGVLNALLNNFEASADRKGLLFEHLFFNQLFVTLNHQDQEFRISTYRTEHGAEVDFILEIDKKVWAMEVKASKNIGKDDLQGFKSFADFYLKPHKQVIVYLGTVLKKIENVMIYPWQDFLKEL